MVSPIKQILDMKTNNIITRCAVLLAAVLTAAGCQKDIPQIEKQPDYSNLRFEVTVGAKGDYDGGEVCIKVRVARQSGAFSQIEATEGCVS